MGCASGSMFLYVIAILSTFKPSCCSLLLVSPVTNVTLEFHDAEASFGPPITDDMPLGRISLSDPIRACAVVSPPPSDNGLFFALIDRGNCTFAEKTLAVQVANYSAAIIVNIDSDYVYPMGSDKSLNITIPAIMIGRSSGDTIKLHYLYNNSLGYKAKFTPNPSTTLEYYLVPLFITMSMAFLAIIIFLGIRVLRSYLQQAKSRLSRDVLNKLPEIRFSEDYQNLYETCAICLEDYAMGDKLRVLPCHHAYHSKCVDRWLLRRQGSCPVCKYRIRRNQDDDADTESEDAAATNDAAVLAVSTSAGPTAPPSAAPAAPAAGLLRRRERSPARSSLGSEADFEVDAEADDIAPLLVVSKSAPVSQWLSGGQLPAHGTTWLGYDNPVADIVDESILGLNQPPLPQETNATIIAAEVTIISPHQSPQASETNHRLSTSPSSTSSSRSSSPPIDV